MKQAVCRHIFLMSTCVPVIAAAQETGSALTPDTVSQIYVHPGPNQHRFSSRLRPLRQIAGAPQAFYSYFWEFGDGSYSTEAEPEHQYGHSGSYDVYLWATNNYDDGTRPPVKYKTVLVSNPARGKAVADPASTQQGQALAIRHNADPKPGETFVCVTSYRMKGQELSTKAEPGTLLVCYNEQHFRTSSFLLEQVRSHNGEREIGEAEFNALIAGPLPGLVAAAAATKPGPGTSENNVSFDQLRSGQQLRELAKITMSQYRDHKIWRTVSTGNQVNNLFLQLQTRPEMIKDTNATVRITALFLPDNTNLDAELTELEMQIVASHDPNRMRVKRNILNYRFVNKRRKMQYTIQFQNTGKGPASRIELQTRVPAFLNTATLQVLDRYPRCPECSSTDDKQSCFSWRSGPDSLYFVFRNIYLPGTQQKGVKEQDSTKGFVTYELNFNKHIPKQSFTSQTAIIFDKNPPVITNKAHNRYQPGLSPGIIAGLYLHGGTWNPDATPEEQQRWEGKQQWVLGVSLAPFAAHRWYPQAEVYLRHQGVRTITGNTLPASGVVVYQGKRYELQDQTKSIRYSSTSAEIAGLFKINLSGWLSLGAGALVSARISEDKSLTTRYSLLSVAEKVDSTMRIPLKGLPLQPAALLDIGLGKVRVGPSLGFRYLQYFQGPAARFFLYATWKL